MFATHRRAWIWTLVLSAPFLSKASAATFTSLGDLPGGFESSEATGVSADGKVVVGVGSSASGQEAFRWTASGGMEGLGDLPGGDFESYATATSADGSVVVGASTGASGRAIFRWTRGTGMERPAGFAGAADWCHAVSADGSVLVGQMQVANGYEAFRWTSGSGPVGLGDLPGGVFQSSAHGISADGQVVVGEGFLFQATEAFRWTSAGMVGLGHFPGALPQSRALAVSANGEVVVGYAAASSMGRHGAFRWTAAEGMVSLGGENPPGWSEATAVSADGSIVVGWLDAQAFIWDAAGGMRSLAEELETVHGLDLRDWELERATGISADGAVIVGVASSKITFLTSPFRVEITPPEVIEPVTYRFSGPLKLKEEGAPLPTYAGVMIGEDMSGSFTIGATEAGSTFAPPATFEFFGSSFFGTLTGDGITTNTGNSARAVEVSYFNDYLPAPDELAVLNACLGTNHPAGTRYDLAEIETDVTLGARRIEFGVSLISFDLNWIAGSDYRAFPSLRDVDAGVYFVVEEHNGSEVFNAIGLLSEFQELTTAIKIVQIARTGDLLTIVFESAPGLSAWKIKGDPTLDRGFPDDLTGLPGSAIAEEPGTPGRYTTTVNVAGRGDDYYLRIER